jgi:hypothetical protein
VPVNLTTTIEALLLNTLNEGVVTADLSNATAVAAEFNREFAITSVVGDDALLVIKATDSNNFSVWQYIEAGTAEIQANELTLIAVFSANSPVDTSYFAFI